jgi:3',5'-cyclic AMP phosphodiesterase CpdA
MFFFPKRNPIIQDMQKTLHSLQSKDAGTLRALNADTESTLSELPLEQKRQQAVLELQQVISFAKKESDPDGHTYHSRDPLTGITQTHLAKNNVEQQLEDNILPELQAFGQGNPIVWIPTGIDGVLEHFKPKAKFKVATAAKSQIQLPDTCKVALLADWGADNDHAKKLGDLAIARGADIVIHLGDIYYSGSKGECETFLKNWPLRDAEGNPAAGKSFALNGNHEMYSLGRYYFTTVLDGLGQEASYFTLSNDWWQLQGLDTAYVPFSISGGTEDTSMKPQWDWLLNSVRSSPKKKNILLSHNQPLSAHLPEFEASYPLNQEYRQLLEATNSNAIFAWFFGHEHRCTIYDDSKTDFKARLIGNGAIPHHPQEEVAPDKDETNTACTPFIEVNKCSLDNGPVAISTFALLSFDKDTCSVEYINEDGTQFYHTEHW